MSDDRNDPEDFPGVDSATDPSGQGDVANSSGVESQPEEQGLSAPNEPAPAPLKDEKAVSNEHLYYSLEEIKGKLDQLYEKEKTSEASQEDAARLLKEMQILKDANKGLVAQLDIDVRDKQALQARIDEENTRIKDLENEVRNGEDGIKERDDKIANLNSAIKKITEDYESKLTKVRNDSEETLKKKQESIDSFAPPEICDLFEYTLGEIGEKADAKRRAIYAYLAFINGRLDGDELQKRFRVFDASLYDALHDMPELLAKCRNYVEPQINNELGKKSGGFQICWPAINETYNPERYEAKAGRGLRIAKVFRALVYKKNDAGKTIPLDRGEVETA